MNAIWLLLFLEFAVLLIFQYKVGNREYSINHFSRLALFIDVTDLLAFGFILSFSFLCATRVGSSYDTEVYEKWYYQVIQKPICQIEGSYGLFFEFFSRFFGFFFGHRFRLFLFAIPFINCLTVYTLLRKNDRVGIVGFLLYAFFIGFYYNYAVLRQSFALTFTIWAFLSWNNKLKLSILLLLAILSHNSAIFIVTVTIVVHFFKFRKQGLTVLWVILFIIYLIPVGEREIQIITQLISSIIPSKMMGRYELYFMTEFAQRPFSFYYVFFFLVMIVLVINLYNDNNPTERHSFLNLKKEKTVIAMSDAEREMICNQKMLNIGLIGLLVLSIGSSFLIIIRIADYAILPSFVFLIPQYLRKKIIIKEKVLLFFFCMVALILNLRIFLLRSPLY